MSTEVPDGMPAGKPKLLEQVRQVLRGNYYSIRTEEAYLGWIRRYILFHGKRHPREMGGAEVGEFLSTLAVEERVSPSTQNQALSALVFLYDKVLRLPLGDLGPIERAKRSRKVPVVLTKEEAKALLTQMEGVELLIAQLLYGSGLRLLESLRLRVKDVDFGYGQITVRDGKGNKDRVTMLPAGAVEPMKRQIERRRIEHRVDVEAGCGGVYLPFALERKYVGAGRNFLWQYVFAARGLSTDPLSGEIRRHHIDELTVQRFMKRAHIPGRLHVNYSISVVPAFRRSFTSAFSPRHWRIVDEQP